MVTLRRVDVPNGRVIFQLDDLVTPVFSAQITLAVNLFTTWDVSEIVQRAFTIQPNVHAIVRVEHGLRLERLMSEHNPFVTIFRSEETNGHITVIYTILQN